MRVVRQPRSPRRPKPRRTLASGTRACTWPRFGSNTSANRPDCPATCLPPVKCVSSRTMGRLLAVTLFGASYSIGPPAPQWAAGETTGTGQPSIARMTLRFVQANGLRFELGGDGRRRPSGALPARLPRASRRLAQPGAGSGRHGLPRMGGEPTRLWKQFAPCRCVGLRLAPARRRCRRPHRRLRRQARDLDRP